MTGVQQFRLPDVGEGLTEADIVEWKVKPGDVVKVNDVVVEIETAKSLVELPSPYAGVVSELLVDQGSTVAVGTPIIAVDTTVGATPTPTPHGDQGEVVAAGAEPAASARGPRLPDLTASVAAGVPVPAQDAAVEPGLIGGPAPGGRTSVLVGYGPRSTEAKRRPRKDAPARPDALAAAAGQQAVQTSVDVGVTETLAAADAGTEDAVPVDASSAEPVDGSSAGGAVHVLAKPPVRKLAKDLGVDLSAVAPTGPGGTITRADVEAALAGRSERPALATARAAEPASPSGAAAAPQTAETRVPIKGVRRMTAQAMVASAFTAPHVTEWLTVDVTRTLELVERLRAHRDFRDVKVSPLLVLAKAMTLAIRRTPEVNATWDEHAQEIVHKHYVNLGIAAATPRGLVVPNVKGADRMTLRELAVALNALVATAREGRTQPAEMTGGTITITNVGVFGVDGGTPIINPGESAILALGAIRQQPWVVDGTVVARPVCQLTLSFDHRIVDGEQGSRFLADVGAVLEDPASALLL